MTDEIIATGKRAGRVGLAALIASMVAHFTGDAVWLTLTPLISAAGKLLRCVFKLNFIPF